MRTTLRSCLAAAVCLLMAGLFQTASAGSTLRTPGRVVVTVDASGVRMTSVLRPGRYRFVVHAIGGSQGLQLIRPRKGYTVEDYQRDTDRFNSGGVRVSRAAQRRVADGVLFRGGVQVERGTRAVFWQTVSRGRLWAVSRLHPRDVHRVRVAGSRLRTTAPATNVTLAVLDGSVQAPVSMPARGILRFRNAGTKSHSVGLAKLAPGRTLADAVAFIDALFSDGAASEAPLPENPFDESVFGAPTMALNPGGQMLLRYSLPPGEYVALCTGFDPASRQLHIQQGELTGVHLG